MDNIKEQDSAEKILNLAVDVLKEEEQLLEEVMEMLEEIEIEAYAASHKHKPKAKRYVYRVGKERFVVTDPLISGAEILTKAKKTPVEKFILRQIIHGGGIEVIEPDQIVDLRAPGIERFRVMPKKAKDGACE